MLCRRNIQWGPAALRKQSWSSIVDRALIWAANGFSRKGLWLTDTALVGQDITGHPDFKAADIIHLHWVNQGFISLSTLRKIIESGKRVVWTMHDEWPLDTIYHYTYGHEPQQAWLPRLIARRKQSIYNLPAPVPAPKGEGQGAAITNALHPAPNAQCLSLGDHISENATTQHLTPNTQRPITFVTCSEWLRSISASKPLAQGQEVVAIPNPIDSTVFHPVEHANRRRVLFVAQNVNDERKGIRYLNEAAAMLPDVEIIALGRDIPYINNVEEMAALYASMDAFVTPSLQDNLPNTIMEAMACGTPCVGFDTGGIPEMIDHRENGYIARYRDAADLAAGIRYVLDDTNHRRLSLAAREKVMRCYSEAAVAEKYKIIYGPPPPYGHLPHGGGRITFTNGGLPLQET